MAGWRKLNAMIHIAMSAAAVEANRRDYVPYGASRGS
jgi:hypothetical protein